VSPLRSATAVQIFVVRARSCRIVLWSSDNGYPSIDIQDLNRQAEGHMDFPE